MSTHIAPASVAACVSRIVLEEKMQKQQGAEDKQAIRDSLKQALVASIVESVKTPDRSVNLKEKKQKLSEMKHRERKLKKKNMAEATICAKIVSGPKYM